MHTVADFSQVAKVKSRRVEMEQKFRFLALTLVICFSMILLRRYIG